MIIRQATADDVTEIKDLYYNSIVSVAGKDYTPEQIAAWASTANKPEGFASRIKEQVFLVAENEINKIIGFASLSKTGYLDLLYTHKDFQRQGVATALLKELLAAAAALRIRVITTEASITAKPFFEKNGFSLVTQQTVFINKIALTNYKMQKKI